MAWIHPTALNAYRRNVAVIGGPLPADSASLFSRSFWAGYRGDRMPKGGDTAAYASGQKRATREPGLSQADAAARAAAQKDRERLAQRALGHQPPVGGA